MVFVLTGLLINFPEIFSLENTGFLDEYLIVLLQKIRSCTKFVEIYLPFFVSRFIMCVWEVFPTNFPTLTKIMGRLEKFGRNCRDLGVWILFS